MTRASLVAVLMSACAMATAAAQAPAPVSAPAPSAAQAGDRPAPRQPSPLTPLEVELVISRFQGEKRISSVPYILAVNAGQTSTGSPETQLNMGTEIPVPTSGFTPAGGDKEPIRSYNYRSVGTSITVAAGGPVEGRFELRLSIDDSSVYSSTENKQGGPIMADTPVFRTFRSRNNLLLRDGQSRQYTAATDRVSGEVVKVDVTLRVVK